MVGRVRRTSLDGAGVVLAHLTELDLGDLHGVGAEDACDRQGEVGEACAVRSCLHALANSPPSMLLELYMPGIMIVGVVSSAVRRGGAEVREGGGMARHVSYSAQGVRTTICDFSTGGFILLSTMALKKTSCWLPLFPHPPFL